MVIAVINGGDKCTNTPSSDIGFIGMSLIRTLDRGKNTEIPARIPHRLWRKARKSFSSLRNVAPLLKVLSILPHQISDLQGSPFVTHSDRILCYARRSVKNITTTYPREHKEQYDCERFYFLGYLMISREKAYI